MLYVVAICLYVCNHFSHPDGGSNPRCVAALYCIPMPGTVNESSAKVHLQRTLRGDNPVVDVHILKHFSTSQQSLVLLEALKSSPSDGKFIAFKLQGLQLSCL